MCRFLENIDFELSKQVEKFEMDNGDIDVFYHKQIHDDLHSMIVNDVFSVPDLKCLENYEKELNGGN